MRQAQRGDPEAFSSLVEKHWSRLVAFARSIVGDADAEDTVQDGLVIAWRKLGGLRSAEAFAAWSLRIVSRTCFRRLRLGRRFVPLSTADELAAPGADHDDGRLDVERLLAALAPRQRAVMYLTVVEGMTDSEIGLVLKLEAASVRSHRRRARERLRHLMAPRPERVEVGHEPAR